MKKNNGYFWINSQNKVTELVLAREENYLRNEGQDPFTRQNCIDIPVNRDLKVRNVKEAIIENAVCINKLIYHEKMHVQKLLERAQLTGNMEMKMVSRAVCGNEAMAYLYYQDEIQGLASQINLSDTELDLLFKEAKKISFAQLKELSESKDEIKMNSSVLSEMARKCGIENIETKKLALVLEKQMKINKGELSGPTVEDICERRIPGLF